MRKTQSSNRAHRQRMCEYARDQYANNAAFKRRQQPSQRDWYAPQAALLSVRHLFELTPARMHRTPRQRGFPPAGLLQAVLGGKYLTTPPA